MVGVVDLVPVEMENGKHCAVANGIQKFVRVPGSRAGVRFPIHGLPQTTTVTRSSGLSKAAPKAWEML